MRMMADPHRRASEIGRNGSMTKGRNGGSRTCLDRCKGAVEVIRMIKGSLANFPREERDRQREDSLDQMEVVVPLPKTTMVLQNNRHNITQAFIAMEVLVSLTSSRICTDILILSISSQEPELPLEEKEHQEEAQEDKRRREETGTAGLRTRIIHRSKGVTSKLS
jgi:hypothetical protein